MKRKILKLFIVTVLSSLILIGCGNKNVEDNNYIVLSDYKNIDFTELDENIDDILDAIMDDLYKKSTVPEPSKEDIDKYIDEFNISLDEYALEENVSREEILSDMGINSNEDLRNLAIKYLKSEVILKEIADKEGLSLTDEVFEDYVDLSCNVLGFESGIQAMEYLNEKGNESLKEEVYESAFDYMVLSHIEEINNERILKELGLD